MLSRTGENVLIFLDYKPDLIWFAITDEPMNMRQLLAVFWVTWHEAPQFPLERLHLHCLIPAACAQQAGDSGDDFINWVACLLCSWQKIRVPFSLTCFLFLLSKWEHTYYCWTVPLLEVFGANLGSFLFPGEVRGF